MREEIESGRMKLTEAFAIACSMSWLAVARRMLRSRSKSDINVALTTRVSMRCTSHLLPGGLAPRHGDIVDDCDPYGPKSMFHSSCKVNPIVHASQSGLVESLRFMLACADRFLISYYEGGVSSTELAAANGCSESLHLLGPTVNGDAMRSFRDGAVAIRRHPVVIASGLAC
jgi:hypothetical protein